MKSRLLSLALVALLLAGATGAHYAYRAYRVASIAVDWRDQIRYQFAEEGAILSGSPSDQVFNTEFLRAIFGDNPALLKRLTASISAGLADPRKLQLAEIAAMLVTYRVGEDEEVRNLCITNIGSYKTNRLKPGFHRDGYMQSLLDRELYQVGNTIIGFLGRDVEMLAADEDKDAQMKIIDSLFTGEVTNLVEAIEQPLFHTLVIPNPRRLLPPQLRPHVSTIIVKGSMHKYHSDTEMLLLCPSPRSAATTAAVIGDLKLAKETLLKTKFGGVAEMKPWGPHVECWWAFEAVMTSEKALLQQDQNLVRYHTTYGRVMNNVVLKGCERMGRDLLAMSKINEERKDPRLADAEMRSGRPSNYWSSSHHWGPNWPIAPPKQDGDDPQAAQLHL
jgi:hypothetical protein